jgi:hypothetical protein
LTASASKIARAASPPLRFTTIAFADETLAPDSGRFAWAGREWTTTAELRSSGGLLRPRIATQSLELTMPLDRAGSVSAVVAADAGASISLGGVDAGAAIGPVTRAPATAGDVTITLTDAALSSATLSGTGFASPRKFCGEQHVLCPMLTCLLRGRAGVHQTRVVPDQPSGPFALMSDGP